MATFSRRQLAIYGVNQLISKQSPTNISAHLAAALISSKRQKDAELLLDDIAEQLEDRGVLTQATVTSATALGPKLREQLAKQVRSATKVEHVFLEEEIDPMVIGGIRIETAIRTWDETIACKLSEIKGGI